MIGDKGTVSLCAVRPHAICTPRGAQSITEPSPDWCDVLSVKDTYREDFNSEAEIIFGAHKVKDALAILDFIWDLFSFVSDIPQIIKLGIEMRQAFYFAGSFVNGLTAAADVFLKEYVEAVYDYINPFDWYVTLIESFLSVAQHFTPPNLKDVEIYNKVAEQEFVAHCILEDGSDVTLKQLIDNNLYIC